MGGDLDGMITLSKSIFEQVHTISLEDCKQRVEEWRYSRVTESQSAEVSSIQDIILRAG